MVVVLLVLLVAGAALVAFTDPSVSVGESFSFDETLSRFASPVCFEACGAFAVELCPDVSFVFDCEGFTLELPAAAPAAVDVVDCRLPPPPLPVLEDDLLKKSNAGGSTGVPRKQRKVRKSSVFGRMFGSSSDT